MVESWRAERKSAADIAIREAVTPDQWAMSPITRSAETPRSR